MKCCPYCKSTNRRRTRRKGYAKRIPYLRLYNCLDCRKNYFWVTFLKLPFRAAATEL